MIKVFESFAGIGTQRMALDRLGIDYESVGISEVEEYALLSYAAIHDGLEDADIESVSDDYKREYLKSLNVPLNTDTFKLKAIKNLDLLYKANILSKNYGDISKISPEELPDMDLFTYSFPCFVADTLLFTDKGYKSIRDIDIGDKVFTHRGFFRSVTNKYNNGIKPTLILDTHVSESIHCTYDHRFLINNKWVKACDIKEGDFFTIPVNNKSDISKDIPYNFREDSLYYFALGNIMFNSSIDNERLIAIPHIDKKILTDLGCLLKGCNDEYMSFYHSALAYVIMDSYLPSYILDLPIELLKSFLEGSFNSDGCIRTVNRNTAYLLGQCLAKVYKKPYFIRCSDDIYTVGFDDFSGAYYEDGCIYTPFIGVTDGEDSEVFDISVDIDSSFTVFNIAVHNCTDISSAGKGMGFSKGSGTRSSLLWECEKIIEVKRPPYLLMENVKAMTFTKNMHGFESWLSILESLGYNNYWQMLNGKDYGIPQNRERLFVVSILKEYDKGFVFPDTVTLEKNSADLLESCVDNKYFLPQKTQDSLVDSLKWKYEKSDSSLIYNKGTISLPCIASSRGRKVNSKGERKKNGKYIQRLEPKMDGCSNTLTTVSKDNYVLTDNFKVRYLTPLECFRFMGVDDADFYKAQKFVSDNQLCRQAGNAIVVNVLYNIFFNLFT